MIQTGMQQRSMVLTKSELESGRSRRWSCKPVQVKKKRLVGVGRKAALPDMEDALVVWIDSLRMENLKVSCSSIQSKALELARERGDQDFSASRGWLEKFFKRHHLSLHRRTTVSQRLPQDLVPKVTGFIMATRHLCHINSYPLGPIGNVDETPLWLDMPGETTVAHTGERSIPIRTTGHDKGRFTVCLAAMADGKKLNPFVVFKGLRPIAELMKIPEVVVAFSKNGWMNEELTKDWVKRAWGSLSFNRRLLVWDAYRCHIMATVRSVVKQTNTDMSIIPGGLTSQLQPADLCWNKPFKEAYKATSPTLLLAMFMLPAKNSACSGFARLGHLFPPTSSLTRSWCVEFLLASMAQTMPVFTVYSIHCLKSGGVVSEALPTITKNTATLLSEAQRQDDDDRDPFADLDDDEEELETNELLVEDFRQYR